MSPRKSPWWRAFDKVERTIGKPLEDAVASSRYVNTMAEGMKLQRAVGGAVGRLASGAVEIVLHAAGVSTRRDVRKVTREIAVLTSEVRALKTAQQTGAQPAPRTRNRKPVGSGDDDA